MKKKRMIIILIISAIILSPIIAVLINPLLMPSDSIRRSILRETPVGTNIEDVLSVIRNRSDWGFRHLDRERGFQRPGAPDPDTGRRPIIGEQYIIAFIGDYRFPITPVSVTVFWGFGADGYLIDVYVWKDIGW